MTSVVPEVSTAFYLRGHPVRIATWKGTRWFVATDVAQALGRIRLVAMRRYVRFKHQQVLTLRFPEGQVNLLMFHEEGLGPVLARRRRSAQTTEFMAKLTSLR